MKLFTVKMRHIVFTSLLLGILFFVQQPVGATPFGEGLFGADVPFGGPTNISVALGGNVSFNVAPNGTLPSIASFSGTGAHTMTITSTDAVGYSIYAYTPSGSSLTNGANSIAASSNSSPAALANNTWGFNITGSTTNFTGLKTTPTLVKTATGPYKSGDNTTVTYGVLTDFHMPPAAYSTNVIYTVVALND